MLSQPGVNTDTCKDEIQHLQTWAADNNLKLNQDKTKEIVIMASRKQAPPPPRPDVERVSRLRVLGVIMNDRLTAADHVTMLQSSSSIQSDVSHASATSARHVDRVTA